MSEPVFSKKSLTMIMNVYEDRIELVDRAVFMKAPTNVIYFKDIKMIGNNGGEFTIYKNDYSSAAFDGIVPLQMNEYILEKANIDPSEKPPAPPTVEKPVEPQVRCPKCGSTQISANRKGITYWTGVIGAKKVIVTCLNCGKQWKAGKH